MIAYAMAYNMAYMRWRESHIRHIMCIETRRLANESSHFQNVIIVKHIDHDYKQAT